MRKWTIPAVLSYSGVYVVEAETKEEALRKLAADEVVEDPFEHHPRGGDVETFDEEIEGDE